MSIPPKIEIITKEENYNVKKYIKNPIIIKLSNKEKILKEKDLQTVILAELKNFFEELGLGYTFVGNEYKIKYNNITRYIDLLLFNYNINSFIIVELKTRKLMSIDESQMEFYIDLVNKTIGIIVTKEQDNFIATFVTEDNIIPITYLIK